MSNPAIVITGAPASGKSVFIRRLRQHPSFSEFVFFDELARLLLEENPDFSNDRHRFHIEIYRRQVEREDSLGERPFVTDRGTLDGFAFHPETAEAVETTISREYRRYTTVVHLGTSAELGEEFYRKDEIRTETIDEVLEIDSAIRRVWEGHPGYEFIPAGRDFDEKYRRFERYLVAHTVSNTNGHRTTGERQL